MVTAGAETVRPAIKHFSTLDSDMACGRSRRPSGSDGSGSGSRGGYAGRRGAGGVVGAMETGSASGEAADALLVAELKLGFKQGKRPFGSGAKAKLLGGGGKETGFLDHRQR